MSRASFSADRALTCGVCGAPAPPPFRAPPAEQAPDLDLRPGEPTRSTLPRWLLTCRRCGAVAPDLAALPSAAAATTESEPYRALPASPARPFLRWAMLCSGHAAAEATLQAAWALDDANDPAAASLRRQAAALWGEPGTPESALRLIDVLRRGGDFTAAAAIDLSDTDETSARLLAFQRERIAAADTARYLISAAPSAPPPAPPT